MPSLQNLQAMREHDAKYAGSTCKSRCMTTLFINVIYSLSID